MENKEQNIDTTKWGYDLDTKVEISGPLFLSLLKIMNKLANEQVTTQYKIDPTSLNHTAQQKNLVNVITNEGVTYFHMLGEMEYLHHKNITEGKAIPMEELTAKLQKKVEEEVKKVQDAAKQPTVAKTVSLGSRNKKKKK